MNDAATPVAGRLTKPTWRDPRLIVGLLLVVASVLAVTGIVRSADATSPFYAAKSTLTPGTPLTEDDVVVTHVRVGTEAYVAAGEEPWGKVLTRVVGEGELIPAGALADADQAEGRPIAVQTTLPLAEGIDSGSLVDVWLTTVVDDVASSSPVGEGLVVDSVDRDGGSLGSAGQETVYVVVPTEDVATFLDAIATEGDISVVGIGTAP